MLSCIKVAVTGGLSSGKSSVCRLFMNLGAYVVSADDIVHQLLSIHTKIGQQVIRLIGQDVVVDHQINRKIIANKVFNHPELLNSLEALLHPEVRKQIENKYKEIKYKQSVPLFVAEIPLLFENNDPYDFDFTVAVVADEITCQSRFISYTGYSKEEFEKRSNRQLTMEEKAQKADFVIFNNGSFNDLKDAVEQIYEKLVNKPNT